jgi:hypothetical protein
MSMGTEDVQILRVESAAVSLVGSLVARAHFVFKRGSSKFHNDSHPLHVGAT